MKDHQSSGPPECCWSLGFLCVCLFITNRETYQGPLTTAVHFMEIKRVSISCSSPGLKKRDGHRIIPICLMFIASWKSRLKREGALVEVNGQTKERTVDEKSD